jgi:hypothetical protein
MDTKYILKSDGLLVVDRGAWASGEDYLPGDLTQNSGSYICTVGHKSASGTEPGVGGTWATVWKALQVVTGTYQSAYFKAEDAAPYYRLKVDAAHDLLIKPNGDLIEFYDNAGAACRASLDIHTGAVVLTGALTVASIATVKTDHQIAINHTNGVALSGAWTTTLVSNVPTVTRTMATTDGLYLVEIKLPKRNAASKGAKLQSVTVSYVNGGTIDTTNDILFVYIIKSTLPTTGSAATGAILAGDADADYDAAHDTKAERLGSGNHTCTVTIPVGERAYAADRETFWLEVYVDDASTANFAFAITGMVANYESAEY